MARWKKSLIVGAVVVGTLFLVLFGGGALMDPNIALDLDKHLSSPPSLLFRFLDNQPGLNAWWSAGQAGAPADDGRMLVKKKSGPDQGQGLAVIFVDEQDRLMETWVIVSSEPPTKIVYAVDLAGAMTVERTLTLTPDGDGTRLTWQEKGRIDRSALRWMKVLMPAQRIIDNFDRALAALDRVAGTRP